MTNFELKSFLSQKQNLKLFMKQWLPLLQGNLEELQSYLYKVSEDNPYIDIKTHFEKSTSFETKSKKLKSGAGFTRSRTSDKIEALTLCENSLYEILHEQIIYPLFPTQKSVDIAHKIILNLDENGYFDGDIEEIANELNIDSNEVERVRKRFAYLEPSGIGAISLKESFEFQLIDYLNENSLDDKLYNLLMQMIDNFENVDKYVDKKGFKEAKSILKKFKNPPNIEYIQAGQEVIPELSVSVKDSQINIEINSKFYPDINIKSDGIDNSEEFAKEKLKEARNLEKLLTLRKSTLYRITLVIIEKQIKFFYGGELTPLKMQDVADELEFNESTISRAISNKYIECDRGVFALRDFFTNEIGSNISSSEIKSFIKSLIEYEDRDSPLTDRDISEYIEQRYGVKLIRRVVTKYRQELNIASSKDRKRLYLIESA